MEKEKNRLSFGKLYNGGRTRKRREWRGLADTWFDYKCWLRTWATLFKFAMNKQCLKGFFRYRWMLGYVSTPDFMDRINDGLRGRQLRMSHLEFDFTIRQIVRTLTLMFEADQNIGGSRELSDKMVVMDENMMEQLMFGFPNLHFMCPQVCAVFALCAVSKDSQIHYIDRAEEFGITGDACAMPKAELGLCLEDDTVNIGKCMLHCNTTCDTSLMGNGIEDWHYKKLSFAIAAPEHIMDELVIEYAVEEIRAAIKFVEDQTGEKWDWDAYFRNMKLFNEQTRIFLEILEVNKTDYPQVPDNNINLYRDLYYTRMLNASCEEYLEVDRKVRDLMYEGYREKELICPEIRHRALMWGVHADYYCAFPNWLLNCWGIVGITHMLNLTSTEIYAQTDTPQNPEQAMHDLADLYVKMIMRNRSEGGFKLGVDDVWRFCEEFNIDMIVMYEQIACKALTGWHGIYEEEAAKRGIHVIWIPHAMLDPRKASRQSIRDHVSRYMRTVLGEKPFDESLEFIDDDNAW